MRHVRPPGAGHRGSLIGGTLQQHAGVAAIAPLKRSATADDCAEAVLALVRNKYVTGEVFVVDGGLTQLN